MDTSDFATKKDVEEIVGKKFDELALMIGKFANSVDERFDRLEKDVFILKDDMREVKRDIKELNKKYDHLIETLDGFLKRLDDIEADNVARDAQFARLQRWIEQIAKETGVKLKLDA